MDFNTLILAVIMGLVFIALPVFLGRKSGKSPMQLIFGNQVKGTLFDKNRKKGEDETGEEKASPPKSALEKNGSKQELLDMISSLASYARRNQFFFLSPGTVMSQGETATLAVILITPCACVGINCFGYGGTIQCERNDTDWMQTLNGEKIALPSPAKKNAAQRRILRQALESCGYGNIPVYVLGAFTNAKARLKHRTGDGFYQKKELLEHLDSDRYHADGGIRPNEVGKALEKLVKRA